MFHSYSTYYRTIASKCYGSSLLLMLYLAKISSLTLFADVVELVDTYALGAYALGREGSSPFIRTISE